MTTSGKIELMAPAGNFESLQAALDNGADSVYFGVEQLNMRARASINCTALPREKSAYLPYPQYNHLRSRSFYY